MTFYAKELDGVCPAFGWQGGPEFFTNVVPLQNGHERRNANWDQVRHRYTLPFTSVPDDAYLAYLKAAFLSMRGQLDSFLIKDWSDNFANDEQFGVGDGVAVTFQLSITSEFGLASYKRNIRKPLDAVVTVNGTPTAVTLNLLTGQVTFSSAPAMGAILRWTGNFRVPVRFANDALPMSIDSRGSDGLRMSGSFELIEVFGE